jgi:hypothetical protein
MEQKYDAVTQNAVYNGGDYKKGGYFTTFTGIKFNPFDPEIWERIDIMDIAHASSNICRFNGHVKMFYSLAQHCVLVSYLCDPADAFEGLLHDGSEAYLSDVVRPVKETEAFESYRKLEKKLEADIARKFGTPFPMSPSVRAADMEIVVWEAEHLFPNPVPEWVLKYKAEHPYTLIPKLEQLVVDTQDRAFFPFNCWPPHLAKAKYLKRFMELQGLFNVNTGTQTIEL